MKNQVRFSSRFPPEQFTIGMPYLMTSQYSRTIEEFNSAISRPYGIFLVLFGSFALLLEWVVWRSIDNRLFLIFTLILFAVPAFASFFLGIKRLALFNKLYTADRDQNN